MSNQLTRRDFAIRTAGFGLAMGLAPGATVAEAEQASRSETSPAVADPYSLVDPELLPALKQFPAVDLSAAVERHIPGPPGAPEVRLWVVDPAPSEKGQAGVASHAWRRPHDARPLVAAPAARDRDRLPLRRHFRGLSAGSGDALSRLA